MRDETHSQQVWAPPWLRELLPQGAGMSSNNHTSVVSGPCTGCAQLRATTLWEVQSSDFSPRSRDHLQFLLV